MVDNDSSDDSWERINSFLDDLAFQSSIEDTISLKFRYRPSAIKSSRSKKYKNFSIYAIRSADNRGYAAGNNFGIELGTQLASDYFWILNNDTYVDPLSLKYLIERVEAEPDAGICGATIKNYDPPYEIQCMGGIRFSHLTGRGQPVNILSNHQAVTNHIIESNVTYISGACMFVTRTFIESVGLMNEAYFLYCEELDWVERMKLSSKLKLCVEQRAVVFHKIGASIGTAKSGAFGSPQSEFYQAKSKLLYFWKYHKSYIFTVWIFMMLRVIKALLKGEYKTSLAITKACLLCKSYQTN